MATMFVLEGERTALWAENDAGQEEVQREDVTRGRIR